MVFDSCKTTAVTLLVLGTLGFLNYSNTFHVPFHFDDFHVVSNLSFEQVLQKFEAGGSRVIPHLTFLFNYWLHGTDVFGYHIFNIVVHIGTAFFVYMFLFLIFSDIHSHTDVSGKHRTRLFPAISDPSYWPALLGSILFLVHPMATQAVNYITQRYASLAGFFYIGALAFFVSARTIFKNKESFLKRPHLIRYIASLVMAVLAMRTKEMAITLPAAIILTEYYFMQSDFMGARKRIVYLLPLLATGFIIPVSDIIGIENIGLDSVSTLQDYTWASGTTITRSAYLFTQFKVIFGIYLKLFVWPIGQNIDHAYMISRTMLDIPTAASFLSLCAILAIGLWIFKYSKFASFGILWFFVTISPTSSIVPNTELVAEHRAYISLMGLSFAVAGLPTWQNLWKRYLLILLPVLLLLAGFTYARNKIWQTDLSMWQDALNKASPFQARPHNNLGLALFNRGHVEDAIQHYRKAVEINPNYVPAHNNLGVALRRQRKYEEAAKHFYEAISISPGFAEAHNNLAVTLTALGRLEEAAKHGFEALRLKPGFARIHAALASVLVGLNRYDEAIDHFYQALKIKPDFAHVHYQLALALNKVSRFKEANAHLSEALRINPDFGKAHHKLGLALAREGKIEEAMHHFKEALRVTPDSPDAHYNLGLALSMRGKPKEALKHLSDAVRIKPDFAEAHYNLGAVLVGQGKQEQAIAHFSEALRIQPDFAAAKQSLNSAQNKVQQSHVSSTATHDD